MKLKNKCIVVFALMFYYLKKLFPPKMTSKISKIKEFISKNIKLYDNLHSSCFICFHYMNNIWIKYSFKTILFCEII